MNTPTYKGEVMLLRWADSSTGGRTVTFTLEDTPDDPERHPFKGLPCGKDGQRFALVVVPIGEAEHPSFEQPTEQPKPERPHRRFDDMPKSQQSALLCNDMEFQEFMLSDDAEQAARRVREYCDVESRSQLDSNAGAAAEWDKLRAQFNQRYGRSAEVRS
jgi:hypothetical protein